MGFPDELIRHHSREAYRSSEISRWCPSFEPLYTYLPCRKDIGTPGLAKLFFENAVYKHIIPGHITDRGTQFTSCFQKLKSAVVRPCAAGHRQSFTPKTDGQTQRRGKARDPLAGTQSP